MKYLIIILYTLILIVGVYYSQAQIKKGIQYYPVHEIDYNPQYQITINNPVVNNERFNYYNPVQQPEIPEIKYDNDKIQKLLNKTQNNEPVFR